MMFKFPDCSSRGEKITTQYTLLVSCLLAIIIYLKFYEIKSKYNTLLITNKPIILLLSTYKIDKFSTIKNYFLQMSKRKYSDSLEDSLDKINPSEIGDQYQLEAPTYYQTQLLKSKGVHRQGISPKAGFAVSRR